MKPKKCKNCGNRFIPQYNPLQYVCTPKCAAEYGKKLNDAKEEKEVLEKVKAMRPEAMHKQYKVDLQREVNKLARKVDLMLGFTTCIDCHRPYGKQQDAAHFHSVGSNSTLRFNLHNLHSANSFCNNYSDVHHVNYKSGLEKRYGAEYLKLVEDLPTVYKELHLSAVEVVEKLKLVRGIIKNIDSFEFENGIDARNQLNSLIGIYK